MTREGWTGLMLALRRAFGYFARKPDCFMPRERNPVTTKQQIAIQRETAQHVQTVARLVSEATAEPDAPEQPIYPDDFDRSMRQLLGRLH